MYCGIDLGSTNIKIALYDNAFQLIDRQSRPVNYIRDYDFVEFDVIQYCQTLCDLLCDMLKHNAITQINQRPLR